MPAPSCRRVKVGSAHGKWGLSFGIVLLAWRHLPVEVYKDDRERWAPGEQVAGIWALCLHRCLLVSLTVARIHVTEMLPEKCKEERAMVSGLKLLMVFPI